jgi:hypothetical protein
MQRVITTAMYGSRVTFRTGENGIPMSRSAQAAQLATRRPPNYFSLLAAWHVNSQRPTDHAQSMAVDCIGDATLKSNGDRCGPTGLPGENPANKSPRTPEWKLL